MKTNDPRLKYNILFWVFLVAAGGMIYVFHQSDDWKCLVIAGGFLFASWYNNYIESVLFPEDSP